jgi:2-amino-4-hydroxy-6-hydroxymethyldihydropteridine diphosphokinase
MVRVYLGIGSNLGNRRKNIQQAILLLKREGIKVNKVSRMIETKPEGGPARQRNFLNGALEAETDFSALKLLRKIKSIEKKLGRLPSVKNGPRTIDLDILLYGNEKISQADLEIPHPRMWKRKFVGKPLKEIAPAIFKKGGR